VPHVPSVVARSSRRVDGRGPLPRSSAAATAAAAGPVPPAAETPGGLPPLPMHVLADIAEGFATAEPLWSAVVRHDPEGRRPVRLIATERYEVWVIGWTTGQHVREPAVLGAGAGSFVLHPSQRRRGT
jgi:hypothetical protein